MTFYESLLFMTSINQSLIRFNIKTSNGKLKEIISSFSVHLILNKNDEIMSNSKTIQNLNESAALIIKYVKNYERDDLFIIGFKNTVFIINQSLLTSLQDSFFLINKDLPIYFLHDTKNAFNSSVKLQNEQFEIDDQNNKEIEAFKEHIIFQWQN